jgi:hypothetical protein
MKKSFAIWATAFMVFSTLAVLATAAAEEGAAGARMNQPAPQWKVNDFWHYEYKGRSTSYSVPVRFGTLPGTAQFQGSLDHFEHFTVSSITNAEYYLVYYEMMHWENGTYTLTPQGYQTSNPATYNYFTKVVYTNPGKIRKSDLSQGETTRDIQSTEVYASTNYGKFNDFSDIETSSITMVGGYFGMLKFPMDFGKTWQISGVTMDHRVGTQTQTYPDSTSDVVTFDITDTATYTSGTGRIDSIFSVQDTPAGTFDDSFKVDLSAFYDFTRTGTVSVNNVPQPPLNQNSPGNYFATTRYYSNKAGNIVNYNSTQQNNGVRLSSYHYISIPPNYKPEMETLGGQQWAPNLPAIVVREGEQTAIEFTVIDHDKDDKLNWTVLSVIGSGSNPQGAKLMDDIPPFAFANPTEPNLNDVHNNKLLITAKQPKTVDRDEYTITINANDGRDGGSLNFSFKVKVQNVNSKPYVAMAVPEIGMRENSTMTCTTWKLTDIFKDLDREAGIVDPLTFTAVVTAGPALNIAIDQDTGIVTITVPDYAADQAPMASWESTIKFTCTDSGSGTPANKLSNNTNAKLRIEHVNHDPLLSANGTDLAEYGLTWPGDQPDSRLDLNKAFFDPDVKYADDSLTFSWSGQKFISVKNNAGRITLTPTLYWNGKETIKFKAVDKVGRSKELRLDCTIMSVNHAPYFCETDMEITWDNEEALTIKEANSPTSAPSKLLLAITVNDPDTLYGTDTHECMWYVNDTNGNQIYKTPRFSLNDDDYEFKTAFTGIAPNAYSSAGSPYEVKVVVRDKGGMVATYIWNITVQDMNRPPLARYDSPIDNKTFTKGKKIYFDAANSSDADAGTATDGRPNIDSLTFIWNSSRQGMIKQDRGQAGAQFTLSNLKVGKHIITLTVMDDNGGQSVTAFTVKVTEPATTPGFEGAFVLVVVAAAAVFVAYRRRK